MTDDLDQLLQEAVRSISVAPDIKTLEHYRVHYLGKKGIITESLKNLGKLSVAERPSVGQRINHIKKEIQTTIETVSDTLKQKQITEQLNQEYIDITLPGRAQNQGTLHPITKTRDRIETLFGQMGFITVDGPEIEDAYHNFEALNIPAWHPARATQDTFYFADHTLLRTQTSPTQIRTMECTPPPLRVIALGRVYRRDFDLTHTPMFHQIEGLMVDENITFADLRSILTQFLTAFFEAELPLRFRASYFPFTEPSAEVDIGCQQCAGRGCRICKQTGWLEVLGCGMVHPHVFNRMGIDSERYTGWAFGAGLDRLTMLRYGITDLRTLFDNDLRFLRQF